MIEYIDYCTFFVNNISFDMKYNWGNFYFEFDFQHSKDYTSDQIQKIVEQFRSDITKEELKQLIFNS